MQKVIFLVDMNAFFISCEMTRNPGLKGKPAAVAGDPKNRRGIILAANYDARKFGIKTAMVVHEALKLCPNLIIVPPDHRFYEQKSKEVMELFSTYTPIIEQNSIDEAWLDMTGCEALFGKPLDCAKKIMNNITEELGLWCSVGISENKFLAKMASEMKKPLGITELWNSDIKFKLWNLPVESMYGVGKQTAQKLYRMGIETIGDLAGFDKNNLAKKLGKSGIELHNHANGIDTSPIISRSDEHVKSIGRSVTLPEDIRDIEAAKEIFIKLAEEVGASARKNEKKGRTVQITIKYSDFKVITRQTTIPATYLTKDIYLAGIELLKKHWNSFRSVRLLGISLGGFNEDYCLDQMSFFDSSKKEIEKKEEKLERAMDEIRNKYGFSKVNRAVVLKSYKNSKRL